MFQLRKTEVPQSSANGQCYRPFLQRALEHFASNVLQCAESIAQDTDQRDHSS